MGVLAAVTLACAALARADPADLVPYCTGAPTPRDSNCRERPTPGALEEGSGLSPGLPDGLTPGSVPVI